TETKASQESSTELLKMFSLKTQIMPNPVEVKVLIGKVPLRMELDTSAEASVLSNFIYEKMFSHFTLKKANVKLKTYDGKVIEPLGGSKKPLFGRDLLNIFNVRVSLNKLDVSRDDIVKKLRLDYEDVFSAKLGKYVYETIDLKLKEKVYG
ncbi:hypothetical protein RN001_000335, partial [Aquatica leii]